MRFAIVLGFISLTSFSILSQAGVLADRAVAIAQKLQQYERRLSSNEAQAIGDNLSRIERIVGAGSTGNAGASLACISNGESGTFEQFTIQDLNRNKPIGSSTTKTSCEAAIKAQNVGLICASNGESGAFEQFTVYDINSPSSVSIGGSTTWTTCMSIVSGSNANMTCASNGESGAFENFTIFNRRLSQRIGGGTALPNCLGTIH